MRVRFIIGQVENGAQVIQVFESWAHQMIPSQFETFAKPYADLAMSILKKRHPEVPVIYFANGGSSYLESQRDTQARWMGRYCAHGSRRGLFTMLCVRCLRALSCEFG